MLYYACKRTDGDAVDMQEVLARLQTAINSEGSQRAFAEKHGISLQYVNDVLRGRREPGKLILDALGIEKIVMYREKQDERDSE